VAIPVIPPIPSIGASAVQATAPTALNPATAGAATPVTGSDSFSTMLGNAIDSLAGTEQTATDLSLQAATGNASIADVTVASTEAQLETEMVTAVRDKAVAAFTTIMNMQA
jgi:flagellar hook-basal body complex protein FliE